jgi:hypothetical protein
VSARIHHLSIWHGPVFLINSRSAAFAVARIFILAGHLANLRPAVLPSSLRIVLSIAFVYSTRPPVLVYSTVSKCFHYEYFPENRKLSRCPVATHLCIPGERSPGMARDNLGPRADLPTLANSLLGPPGGDEMLPILSILNGSKFLNKFKKRTCQTPKSTGILACCPSVTPFGLSLGPTYPTLINIGSETLGFRRSDFSSESRYSYRHSHFLPLQHPSRVHLHCCKNAPLPLALLHANPKLRYLV